MIVPKSLRPVKSAESSLISNASIATGIKQHFYNVRVTTTNRSNQSRALFRVRRTRERNTSNTASLQNSFESLLNGFLGLAAFHIALCIYVSAGIYHRADQLRMALRSGE